MKQFFAFGLCVVSGLGAGPQRPPAPAGALGGSFVSVGMSRPLGGIAPPVKHMSPSAKPAPGRYVGPIYYVPNVYDTSAYYQADYPSAYAPPAYAPPAYAPPASPAPTVPPQPIVINQYFGTNTSSLGTTTTTYQEAPPGPGDPIAPPSNYYLIQYKNHTIYSALAYWLEGDTLHYVTTQNTHNQASLALIDLDATTRLNADRSVPFSIAGQ